MAIDVGEPMGPVATPGSVLFVGSGPALSQDNAGFYFDQGNNTLKSANAASGGNSENFSISTGLGGAGNSGAPPAGTSGDLLLKTGTGGSDPFGTAGNAGNIILQPGTTAGGSGGSGGSTIVRAPANAPGNIFAIQNDTGVNTFWSVSNAVTPGALTGTRPLLVSHSTTGAQTTMSLSGTGAKTASFTAAEFAAPATSNTGSITKTGLSVQSTGTWNGAGAVNRALHVNATGGASNFAAVFENGNVGVNESNPSARLHLAAGTATLAPLKLTAGTNLTAPAAGAMEFDGTDLFITNSSNRRRYLTNDMANVLDFGALGDGIADDSAAFQAAVNSLVGTGGIVWVPPNGKYVVGNVTIAAKYPVWIKSAMFAHNTPGGATNTLNDKASIVPPPPPATPTHIFKWERHSNLATNGSGAGGGIEGVVINDITNNNTANRTTPISSAAIWVDDATDFLIQECMFQWLKGTVVKVAQSTFCKIEKCQLDRCGATSAEISGGRPVIDIGGATTQAFVWARRVFSQDHSSEAVMVRSNGGWEEHAGYYENSLGTPSSTIDASGGRLEAYNTSFGSAGVATTIVIGAAKSILDGCSFDVHPAENNVIKINSAAVSTRISNCYLRAAGQTGALIDIGAHYCQLTNLYGDGGGSIRFTTGWFGQLNGMYWVFPGAPSGQYAIDLSNGGATSYNNATNVYLNGQNVSVCHGILGHRSNITGCTIRLFKSDVNVIGIQQSHLWDVCVGNQIYELSAGSTPFVYFPGAVASGNYGFVNSEVANAAGAATLDAESGTITTQPLMTGVGQTYILTLTNSAINADSRVMVSVDTGGDTGSRDYQVKEVQPYHGGCYISVKNTGANQLNGAIKISFVVHNG